MSDFGHYAVALYDTAFWFAVQTDTASVLSEATEYIQFLHEQVKVRLFRSDGDMGLRFCDDLPFHFVKWV